MLEDGFERLLAGKNDVEVLVRSAVEGRH